MRMCKEDKINDMGKKINVDFLIYFDNLRC